MTKYTIEYCGESISVDSATYIEWKKEQRNIAEIIGASEEEKDNASLWFTYEFLFLRGYLVSKPSEPETFLAKTLNTPIENNFPVYEEEWTKEKILNEKSKLLRDKEAFLRKRELALEKKRKELQATQNVSSNTTDNYAAAVVSIIFLTLILLLLGLIVK